MKSIFKPYRLINDLDLNALQQTLNSALQHWNDGYALFPLSCHLGTIKTHCWAKAQHTSSVKTDNLDLSLIKQTLFGDESDCFNTLADTLFATLLNQLFGTQSYDPIEEWFYVGSPSLILTLSSSGKTMTLYLHPQWVLDALPSKNTSPKPPPTLHQALATQHVDLNVTLNPLSLKLADIIRLNVGDVIKTDHSITEPAQLSHQQKSICNVELGATDSFKSIQITRKS